MVRHGEANSRFSQLGERAPKKPAAAYSHFANQQEITI
jgi:hypothetical protein